MLTTVRSFQGIARRCSLERALETVTCLLAPSCYPCPGTAPPYWQHRLAEALPWFERAVEIDPVWEPALNRLVDTSVGLGRTEEVVGRPRRWAEQWPGGVTFRVLSGALRVAGRFPEVDAARSAFELDPVLRSRHQLAVSLVWADLAPEAEKVLRPVFSPGGSAVDRRQAVWALLHALEHQGRHADAMRALDELPGEPALLWFRFAVLCGGARHRGGSDAADSQRQGVEDGKEILRLGVKVEDLTVCLTLLGAHELAGETARRHPLGPDYLEAIRTWQRGDYPASLAVLRRLARNRGPWIRGFNQFWIATVAFDAGLQPEAFDAMAAFEREGSGPWRATGLAELLLAKAAAHERMGERSLAVASVERLLEAWSRADPDLPLLAEARALCRKLGCRERVRPVSAK